MTYSLYFGPLKVLKVIYRSFDPPYVNFSNDRISCAKELRSLKILSLLEADDSLVTLPMIWGTSPRE